MQGRIRSKLTYANVMASLAMFIVLGGGAYAATVLPKNSVGTKQLKKAAVTNAKIKGSAVTSGKVKNGSLLAADFKAGQLPAGPPGQKGDTGAAGAAGTPGEKGDKGDTGDAGTAVAYAMVLPGGTVDDRFTKGITDANITHPAAGVYCFKDLPFAVKSINVSPDNSFARNDVIASGALKLAFNLDQCDADGSHVARVRTLDLDNTDGNTNTYAPALRDTRFNVWFED